MLQQISMYLLKAICISGLLFLYYHIALRNKKFHYYNRFYLLMAVVISIMLPLLKLEWFTLFSNSDQTIHLYKVIYGDGENEVLITGNSSLSAGQVVIYTLAAISIVLIFIQVARIIRIEYLKRQYPVQQFSDFDFVQTDISSAPFSFLKSIFWRNDINLEDETGKQILQHEITHIRQKHSWDKLFIQLVLCFYWLNPFFHFIKKELYLIHEFIADEEAVKHADADAFAKMLLTAQFGKFDFLPAQSIFYSSIKRRLTMLTTSKKPQFSYVRRLLVLPLIGALVCLFAFTVKTRNAEHHSPAVTAAKPFILVVDAGHGGTDNGAVANGLYEKDAVLKIAQKIKEFSAQYNIDVILTRNNDVYMNVKEKSAFANTQNADAMISLHINADFKDHQNLSGFEVMLSHNNEKFAVQNQALGSAILQNVSTEFNPAQSLSSSIAGIWILKNSNIPSALLECGYITNKTDAANLKDDAKIELMAKNILAGVAAYANNVNDGAQTPQLKNINDTIPATQPLYVLDGKIVSKETIDKLDQNTIESLTVWKDKDATDKYGDKGKNGVVEITMKKAYTGDGLPPNALYVLDGKIISTEEATKKVDGADIKTINVLKDKSATAKYGDKGKNGVVEMISKRDTDKEPPTVWKVPGNVLYIVNGKESTKAAVDKIDKKTIESINVVKDKAATDKYGDKGKNGVIEITLKSGVVKFAPPLIVRDSDGVVNPSDNIGNKPVFTDAQIQPKFPGGAEGWQNYLVKNLKADVPAQHKAPPGTYVATVSFQVNENGKVSDVKAVADPGYGTGAEAVRVIAQGPNWIPAEQNGHKVISLTKQKIAFQITE